MELQQFGLDLLLQVGGDDLELPGVLEHFPGDIQGEVGGVHHAPDEGEAVGHQVGALVHDEHAGGVKLQAFLILPGVKVKGGPGGKIEQSLILHHALGGGVDHRQGVLPVSELLLVELVVVLVLQLALGPLPQGHHGVEGLPLLHSLILGPVVLRRVPRLGLLMGVLHLHDDGIVDIVGVFLHQLIQPVGLQIGVVVVVLGVVLDVQGDVGAHGRFFTGGEGVAVRPGGLPLPRLVRAVGPGDHRHPVGHHEGGIEAHAELADDVGLVPLVLLGQLLLELERAAAGDGAQVGLQLLLGHADAVVGDGEGTLLLVRDQRNFEVSPVQTHLIVGEGLVGQLVHRVAGVGDELPEENLLVGVDGVDHQVQQPL